MIARGGARGERHADAATEVLGYTGRKIEDNAMSEAIKGSCLCGGVTYRYRGPEYVFQYCHCSRCRKFTGSAHSAHILVKPENFEWLSGEDLVGRYELPGARHFATCFCTRCGSSLPWLSQSGGAVMITAGTLDEDPGIQPTQNIYYASRPPWRVDVDAIDKHDELPPRQRKGD